MNLSSLLGEIDAGEFGRHLEEIQRSLGFFGIEFLVALSALIIILCDLAVPQRHSKHLAWFALIACLLPAWSLLGAEVVEEESSSSRLFLGMVSFDSYSSFYKLFFLLGSIPVIILTYVSKELEGRRMGEYYGILLAAVFGAMLMASSTHFLMLFMSLELISICSYVLVGYKRRDNKGVEAALKYIIYGSVAAAVMIYGMSLYYGLTGSADLADLANVASATTTGGEAYRQSLAAAALLALVLIFVGIAYKISSIPMHFWAPDAYEGAPTPITAFLSVLSKAAGFALALRLFQSLNDAVTGLREAGASAAGGVWEVAGVPGTAGGGLSPWIGLLILLSILTMTLGNLAALWQTNLKRLLAYSSIAHAGYMMMGFTILSGEEVNGIQAVSFYLLAYLAMNFGAFAVVILIENSTGSVDIADYRGLGKRAPFLGAAMIVFLFSLIGVPPTAGFTGKWQLFMGVLDMGRPEYYVLAVAAAANTALSAYYYLRIAREMYLDDSEEGGRLSYSFLGGALVLAMVILTFYLFVGADRFLNVTGALELRV